MAQIGLLLAMLISAFTLVCETIGPNPAEPHDDAGAMFRPTATPEPTTLHQEPTPVASPTKAGSVAEAKEILRGLELPEEIKERFLSQPFLDSWEPSDNHILEKLVRSATDPEQLKINLEFMDRTHIYDIGAPEIAVQDRLAAGSPRLYRRVESFLINGRKIEILILGHGIPDAGLAQPAAEAVAAAEELFGREFPLPDQPVIIAVARDPQIGSSAAANYGNFIIIKPEYAAAGHPRRNRIISHEIAHFWFLGQGDLINEGIAEMLANVVEADGGEPAAYGGPGIYGRGEACLMGLYQAGGKERFSESLGELYDLTTVGKKLTLAHLAQAFDGIRYAEALAGCR